MRLIFTDLQVKTTGQLPYIQREGEYEVAERALETINLLDINKRFARDELQSLKETLKKRPLDWEFYRGKCLGVNRHRVHMSLVPYVIQEKMGRVYRIELKDIPDFLSIVHGWRYSGVHMEGLDAELSNYGINEEVPYEDFKEAIDTMWVEGAGTERIVFQKDGVPVSVYGTPTILTSGTQETILEAVDLSAYETMCQHVVSCMMELPKSVVLLGVSEYDCFVLDKTGRNEQDIIATFSDLVYPNRYFSRYIKFTGKVTRVEDEGLYF